MTSPLTSPFANFQRSQSISSAASDLLDVKGYASLSRASTASVFSDADSEASDVSRGSAPQAAALGVAQGLANQASLQDVAGAHKTQGTKLPLPRATSLGNLQAGATGTNSPEAKFQTQQRQRRNSLEPQGSPDTPAPNPSNQDKSAPTTNNNINNSNNSGHIVELKNKFKLNQQADFTVTNQFTEKDLERQIPKNSNSVICIDSINPDLVPLLMELLNKHSRMVVFKQSAYDTIISKANDLGDRLTKVANLKGIAFYGCKLNAADIKKIVNPKHIKQIKDVLLSNCTFENEESQKEVLRTIAPQAKKISFSGTNIPPAASLLLMYPHGITIGIDNNDSDFIKKWYHKLFDNENKGLLSNLKGLEIPNYVASDEELKRLLDDSYIEHLTLSQVTTKPDTVLKEKVHNILVEKFKQNIKFDIKFTDNTFEWPKLIQEARGEAVKQQKEAIEKDKAAKAAAAAAAADGTQQGAAQTQPQTAEPTGTPAQPASPQNRTP